MRREIAEGCHVPGRTDQGFKTPRRSAARRCRVPLFPGDPGNTPRPVTSAPFGAPPPLTLGWDQGKARAHGVARMRKLGCLKCESEIRDGAPIQPTVIPGRAASREPGIHNHDWGLWIPGLRRRAHPGMTVASWMA